MGTRIKLKRKLCSSVVGLVKKYPTLPVATASLGVSSANLMTNIRRNKRDKEFREDQLKTTKELINSLKKVDKSLEESNKSRNKENSTKNKRLIRFIPFVKK